MGKEVIRVVAAVIEHEGRYLITQRQASTILQTTTQAVAQQLGQSLLDQWQEVRRLAAFAEQDGAGDEQRGAVTRHGLPPALVFALFRSGGAR